MHTFIETAAAAVTLGSLGLNAWHHVGFPVAMKLAARAMGAPAEMPLPADADLPEITVVMPAYNEAAHIGAKLRNLAAIDYPADRLHILVACDGCTDDTVRIARSTLAESGCTHLDATVIDHTRNRGKVAVLNGTIAMVNTEVVVLTDVSAMLPPDALRRAGAHFADPKLGAVGGTYRLNKPGSVGEANYWQYQVAVKRGESAMGCPLGLHGAFYAFRRAAWAPLPADTINDDFIMPLEIFGRGWRVAYDATIVAFEDEMTSPAQEINRRRRIAGGNAQQIVRLAWLLNPKFGGVALSFASGKVLRVAAPFLIVIGLLGSIGLAAGSALFATLAAVQIAGLLGAGVGALLGDAAPPGLAVARYALAGHMASATGVVRYFSGAYTKPWRFDVLA
jgi:cellulose synthase/poly-beta-1,6-N-acetylglucosamine synthase-like glycosyltransferase